MAVGSILAMARGRVMHQKFWWKSKRKNCKKRNSFKGRVIFLLLFLFALLGKLKNPYFSFLHSWGNRNRKFLTFLFCTFQEITNSLLLLFALSYHDTLLFFKY
jgi:hypothetical protein